MFDFLFSKQSKKRKSLGLALSGGAARGIAHLGVIKALEDNHIPISAISGVSSGSLIGGLYAAGLPLDELIKQVKEVRWYDLAGVQLSKRGMVSSRRIERFVDKLVGPVTFKELKIPFMTLATDILAGKGVQMNDPDMKLSKAIRASASFPGVYSPVKIGDRYFIDGGATCNIPVNEVRQLGADFVISVDAVPDVTLDKLPSNLLRIADRSVDLLLHKNKTEKRPNVDLPLKPVKEAISSFDLHRGDDLVRFGEESIYPYLPMIKKKLGIKE